MQMEITVNFDDRTSGRAIHNIYKVTNGTIIIENLTTPITSLAMGEVEFIDTDISIGDYTNSYIVEAVSNGLSEFSPVSTMELDWYVDNFDYFETNDYTVRVVSNISPQPLYSLYYDGSIDDEVIVPNSVVEGLGDFTITARIMPTGSFPTWMPVVSVYGAGYSNILIYGLKSGEVTFNIQDQGDVVGSAVSLDESIWLTITRSGSTTYSYINGILDTHVTHLSNPIASVSGYTIGQEQDAPLGKYNEDQAFEGHLMYYSIFSDYRTEAEVQAEILGSDILTDPSLELLYIPSIDDTTVLPDLSGNGNNGSILGAEATLLGYE